jgi:hypothetical protein
LWTPTEVTKTTDSESVGSLRATQTSKLTATQTSKLTATQTSKPVAQTIKVAKQQEHAAEVDETKRAMKNAANGLKTQIQMGETLPCSPDFGQMVVAAGTHTTGRVLGRKPMVSRHVPQRAASISPVRSGTVSFGQLHSRSQGC